MQYTKIDQQCIDRIRYHDFYCDVDRVDMHSKAALNAVVKVQQQRVLYLSGAKANNCEVGCLIDQTSGAASYTTAYKLDQVRLQDKMINQLRQNRDR